MMLRRCKNSAPLARRGFTLTEIAIVLGIIGLILGAIWAAASAVYNNLRTSRAQQEILTVAQNIRAMYATQSTVDANATTDTYINAGVFPSDATVEVPGGSKSTKNPWGGKFDVVPGPSFNDNTTFSVVMEGIPINACITLSTSTTGTGRDSGLVSLKVNDSDVGTLDAGTFPVGAKTASDSCTQGSATAGVKLAWEFRLRS